MTRVHLTAFLLLCFSLVGAAVPLPEQVADDFPNLRLAGEGRLRWLGLHIYDAALWINRYSKYWQAQFDILAKHLIRIEEDKT